MVLDSIGEVSGEVIVVVDELLFCARESCFRFSLMRDAMEGP